MTPPQTGVGLGLRSRPLPGSHASPKDPKSFQGHSPSLRQAPTCGEVPSSANPGPASCWVWLSRGGVTEGGGHRGEG